MWWVLLFAVIAVGGLALLAHVVLRLWRSARALLEELDVVAGQAGELVDLLAQIEVVDVRHSDDQTDDRTAAAPGAELTSDDAWPGTVKTYSDQGAPAPGKKES